ncbi:hypothetical protein CALVIDRAFT_56606 [Calocera viscosa TUFC12733]|uniref:CxC1-like cysteine cluster associated with KDZ transposases domain-containing protein n=1 Tax=Calocera viscosa (strain TUFC12733) TaxID=1330018 RepID=A0A167FIX2_CALVF|nr:hypothetical protein CALVIDRAFT_56606 [Calocera viscosa TUFC12733]
MNVDLSSQARISRLDRAAPNVAWKSCWSSLSSPVHRHPTLAVVEKCFPCSLSIDEQQRTQLKSMHFSKAIQKKLRPQNMFRKSTRTLRCWIPIAKLHGRMSRRRATFRKMTTSFQPGTTSHTHITLLDKDRMHDDSRTWRQLLPDLVQDYLLHRHGTQQPCLDAPPCVFTISVVTWSGTQLVSFPIPDQRISPIRILMRHGYLACSPDQPQPAIHLDLLELQHHLRMRAYVSHEAWSRVLCDLHGPDPFPAVLPETSCQRIRRDTPNRRIKNSCPACEYKLEGEPTLPISRLICGDGNNSSKRFAHGAHQDLRAYDSNYIIHPDVVNQFQHDVRRRHSSGEVCIVNRDLCSSLQ